MCNKVSFVYGHHYTSEVNIKKHGEPSHTPTTDSKYQVMVKYIDVIKKLDFVGVEMYMR